MAQRVFSGIIYIDRLIITKMEGLVDSGYVAS